MGERSYAAVELGLRGTSDFDVNAAPTEEVVYSIRAFATVEDASEHVDDSIIADLAVEGAIDHVINKVNVLTPVERPSRLGECLVCSRTAEVSSAVHCDDDVVAVTSNEGAAGHVDYNIEDRI